MRPKEPDASGAVIDRWPQVAGSSTVRSALGTDASGSSSSNVRCSWATRATRRRLRYLERSVLVAADASSAAQSIGAPSATDSRSASYSRSGSIELLHEASERARHGDAGGVGVWLTQNHCKFLVIVLQL